MTPQDDQIKKHRYTYIVPVFLIFFIMLFFVYSGTVPSKINEYVNLEEPSGQEEDVIDDSEIPNIQHTELPEEVRGIYWTAYTAGSVRGQQLLDYMIQTGLNTAVIDLKMDNGELAFVPVNTVLAPYVMAKPAIGDLDIFLL